MAKSKAPASKLEHLQKVPTGIDGFDVITHGGLPKGRPTLVCGGAGCGKSMFASEFLVRGAMEFDEPGVLMTFEETADERGGRPAVHRIDAPRARGDRVRHERVAVAREQPIG